MQTGSAIRWKRVTQVPDFVYFNHAMHVTNKVTCETCHGQVSEMAVVRQTRPLTMSWCVDCHRDAEKASVAVTRSHSLTDCTTCHR